MIERGDRVRGAPSYAYTQNQSRITRDTHKTVSIQNVVARVARVPSTHRASDRIINQSINHQCGNLDRKIGAKK
jgi:hypothetical protein